MRILCLNTWHGGKLKEEITTFFQTHKKTVDIFCLQETSDSLDSIIAPLLESYFLVRTSKSINNDQCFALSILVRKDITMRSHGTLLDDVPKTGYGQWVEVEREDEKYWICNYHGTALPGEKEDNPERLFASRALITEGERHTCPSVIMGDLNLLETTESVAMFVTNGYRDLIKEYKIPTTRNILAWDRFPGKKQMYSDYAFVKGTAHIDGFEVLPDLVSDHQPLVLDVSAL